MPSPETTQLAADDYGSGARGGCTNKIPKILDQEKKCMYQKSIWIYKKTINIKKLCMTNSIYIYLKKSVDLDIKKICILDLENKRVNL